MWKDADNLLISQLWGELGLPRSPCGEVHCAERYLAETISYVKLCEYVDGIAGRLNMFCYPSLFMWWNGGGCYPPATERQWRLMPEPESQGQKNTSIKNMWQLNYMKICIWMLLCTHRVVVSRNKHFAGTILLGLIRAICLALMPKEVGLPN